jgi:hypothetical protein
MEAVKKDGGVVQSGPKTPFFPGGAQVKVQGFGVSCTLATCVTLGKPPDFLSLGFLIYKMK